MNHLRRDDPELAALIDDETRRIETTLDNAAALAAALQRHGYRIVTGGTDNHQVLVDLTDQAIGGREAQDRLEAVGIVTNRNRIPSDADHPGRVGGLRLGTAAVTTRGMGPAEMETIAELIQGGLCRTEDRAGQAEVAASVAALCRRFPVYSGG